MNSEELKTRSKNFARRCLKLTKSIPPTYEGIYISKQLKRSALSTAANYRAACLAQSADHFIAKISIVVEEADESLFWIEMLEEELLIEPSRLKNLKQEALELTRIFLSSRLTAKQNNEKKKNKNSKIPK